MCRIALGIVPTYWFRHLPNASACSFVRSRTGHRACAATYLEMWTYNWTYREEVMWHISGKPTCYPGQTHNVCTQTVHKCEGDARRLWWEYGEGNMYRQRLHVMSANHTFLSIVFTLCPHLKLLIWLAVCASTASLSQRSLHDTLQQLIGVTKKNEERRKTGTRGRTEGMREERKEGRKERTHEIKLRKKDGRQEGDKQNETEGQSKRRRRRSRRRKGRKRRRRRIKRMIHTTDNYEGDGHHNWSLDLRGAPLV